jgi:formylmethanofuran dehydrogenase subunit A
VYRRGRDIARMFREAALVVKDGTVVVKSGRVVNETKGRALTVKPGSGEAMRRRLDRYYDDRFGLPSTLFAVTESAVGGEDRFAEVTCRS